MMRRVGLEMSRKCTWSVKFVSVFVACSAAFGGALLASSGSSVRDPKPPRAEARRAAPAPTCPRDSVCRGGNPATGLARGISPVIPDTVTRPVPVPRDFSERARISLPGAVEEREADGNAVPEARDLPGDPAAGGPVDEPGGLHGGVLGQRLDTGFGRASDPEVLAFSRVLPRYPEPALRAGVEGQVVLRAVVREDGSVGSLRVVRGPASRMGFERAAVRAIRRWRYEPGLQNGRPVDVHVTFVVDFTLAR